MERRIPEKVEITCDICHKSINPDRHKIDFIHPNPERSSSYDYCRFCYGDVCDAYNKVRHEIAKRRIWEEKKQRKENKHEMPRL